MTDVTPTPDPEVPAPDPAVAPPSAATPPPYVAPQEPMAPQYAPPVAPQQSVAPPVAPSYAQQPQPQYVQVVPGKTLGIVALVLSLLGGLSVIGIILGFVARAQSKAAGFPNTPAKIAIIIGFIVVGLATIGIILFFVVAGSLVDYCAGVEPGTYQLEDGRTITCG
jgi:hypothetical protein